MMLRETMANLAPRETAIGAAQRDRFDYHNRKVSKATLSREHEIWLVHLHILANDWPLAPGKERIAAPDGDNLHRNVLFRQ